MQQAGSGRGEENNSPPRRGQAVHGSCCFSAAADRLPLYLARERAGYQLVDSLKGRDGPGSSFLVPPAWRACLCSCPARGLEHMRTAIPELFSKHQEFLALETNARPWPVCNVKATALDYYLFRRAKPKLQSQSSASSLPFSSQRLHDFALLVYLP